MVKSGTIRLASWCCINTAVHGDEIATAERCPDMYTVQYLSNLWKALGGAFSPANRKSPPPPGINVI